MNSFFEGVRKKTKTIRHELSQRIRFQVKSIPELEFFIDDSYDYAENIDKLLND